MLLFDDDDDGDDGGDGDDDDYDDDCDDCDDCDDGDGDDDVYMLVRGIALTSKRKLVHVFESSYSRSHLFVCGCIVGR